MRLVLSRSTLLQLLPVLCGLPMVCALPSWAANLDLRNAQIVAGSPHQVAATVLIEEVERRSGVRLSLAPKPAAGKTSITIGTQPGLPPEGYRLEVGDNITIQGADSRGALYGVGALLRRMDWAAGEISVAAPLALSSSPVSPIRGHQLGYRATANSWDAWTLAQFDQYIRELALFGVNSIENIPFQDTKASPHMKLPRREMNRGMSAICRKYGLDYWVWTPADFDLNDKLLRAEMLDKLEQLFQESVELSGVFVPGGDPGSNPPDLVMAFLADTASRLAKHHPRARLWLSLQGFSAEKEEFVYDFINTRKPTWLGGLVVGPSSPPLWRSRARLPRQYKIRLYPDITHNKISQFQVPAWDQAYALTLGREAINPRPAEYAQIHNRYATASDGFISYSDGVHDDVNKIIYSALAWNPDLTAREILIDYARLFFSTPLAPEVADAILALERNWRGPLVNNGSVEATLREWQWLEGKLPALEGNWRWQMCLLRANYDAYLRRKQIWQSQQERAANTAILAARSSEQALREARQLLAIEPLPPPIAMLRNRIMNLCEQLFGSIGLQTSVEKYAASGAERGAVLDFVDTPLNNKWWLEDEWEKLSSLPDERAKMKRLRELALWEQPGPGSYYDDIGNIARSPRVDGDLEDEPGAFHGAEPMFWWLDQGRSRLRLSWQTTMWPRQMVYEGLDPGAKYTVRTAGQGQCLLLVDGQRVQPRTGGKLPGGFNEFTIPADALTDGRLTLTFEIPKDEGHLNWRQRSRLAEVWLLKTN